MLCNVTCNSGMEGSKIYLRHTVKKKEWEKRNGGGGENTGGRWKKKR